MRCPKCHYLSFEPEPRCRNCGYDLSFEPGDLFEKPGDPVEEVLPDLELRHAVVAAVAVPAGPAEPAIPVIPVGQPPAPRAQAEVALPADIRRLPTSPVPELTAELPLFVRGLAEPPADESEPLAEAELEPEEPLVKLPRAPRPPLSVRRHTPAPGRVREKYQARADNARQIGLLERDLLGMPDSDYDVDGFVPIAAGPVHAPTPAVAAEESHEQPAGAARRLEAACVDLLFIGSINLAIVWLTLQRCELTLRQIGVLPVLPVAALLFLLDGLYLLMFTATNGQTIGKMTAGIRVVGTSSDAILNDRVTLKQAVIRAVLTFPSVLALGAGFVPALLGRGLALHDRFAHTRVVRA